jgi:dephospho-CoA kinase
MLTLGIVGDIGSGKTEVLRLLRECGAVVLEADAIAREVVAPGSPALRAIVARFGNQYLLPDGTLDRKALGRLVFSDEAARRALNDIMYPAIRDRIAARLEELRGSSAPPEIVAVEAAVLKEMNALSWADVLVQVHAPRPVRLARIQARDGLTRAEAEARLAAQERAGVSDVEAAFVVDNGADHQALRELVMDLWSRLRASQAQASGSPR